LIGRNLTLGPSLPQKESGTGKEREDSKIDWEKPHPRSLSTGWRGKTGRLIGSYKRVDILKTNPEWGSTFSNHGCNPWNAGAAHKNPYSTYIYCIIKVEKRYSDEGLPDGQ
jgi:hypothetical protein